MKLRRRMEKPNNQSKVEDRKKGTKGDQNLPQGRRAKMREDAIFIPLNLVITNTLLPLLRERPYQ